ncbi:MAG: Cys-tRNA(Pro) deacylase, partial [Muribaculaceae bacterium]|nr:Cys-tRNA(Pro) deacylase [Muribaculaceae bacterium]
AGDREVNLKKAAKVSGNKKAEMIHQKELLPLTGYIRGGCTAIGMKKDYPVFFSSEFCDFDRVYVSAGQRGLQLEVPPAEFMAVARGTLADITDVNVDEA